MARFLLVHGAFHGAWCWEELEPELARLGHEVRAIDLPGNGSDPAAPADVSLADYVERVGMELDAFGGKVWLVGHSLGGLTVTAAGERYAGQLDGLIYIAALLMTDGKPFAAKAAASPVSELDFAGIGPRFYNTCEARHVERAAAMLNPVQNLSPLAEATPLSAGRYGTLPRHYVECLQDNALALETQRQLYKAAGIDSVATLDCDHSPFYSCPAELAAALDGFVSR